MLKSRNPPLQEYTVENLDSQHPEFSDPEGVYLPMQSRRNPSIHGIDHRDDKQTFVDFPECRESHLRNPFVAHPACKSTPNRQVPALPPTIIFLDPQSSEPPESAETSAWPALSLTFGGENRKNALE